MHSRSCCKMNGVRQETPYPAGMALLTGHERRDVNWCWRPRGTSIPLLIHTRSGEAVVRVNDVEHPLTTGDTVVWDAGAAQDFGCCRSTRPWEIIWAHFPPRSHWYDWLTWPTLGPGVRRIPLPQPGLHARIDAALLDMDVSAHGASPRTVDFALNALERALLWLDAANPARRQLDDRLREAILFVGHHLDRPLSVAAIADAVQLSPSRLSHLFTEQIGIPPGRYVERRRIERAQALLVSSSLSIGAIAATTGFSSQFYFATRFRAVVKMTPRDWRQRTGTQRDLID